MHFKQISLILEYRSIFPTIERVYEIAIIASKVDVCAAAAAKKIMITSPTFRLFATDFAPE